MSEVLKLQNTVQRYNGKYVLDGNESEVKYLIYHNAHPKCGEVIVFVDNELDLDWECDDTASQLTDEMPLKASVRKILNQVAVLEPIVHNWPDDLKLMAKRLLGEAVASVLCDDVVGAEAAIENAKKFIIAKSRQVSRYWTLQSCLITGGVAALVGLLEVLARFTIIGLLGRTTFLMSLCFCAGCVGALLFVVMRLGSQPTADSTTERQLHYLEGVARIGGGGIAGVLIGGMVSLGLVLPVFSQAGMESLAMCSAAMIAGASERLVAGIITRTEGNETTVPETPNVDK